MQKIIYFDMDGTLADFYSQKDWLLNLELENPEPYKNAKGINLREIAVLLKKLKAKGYKLGIVSWLSKSGSYSFNEKVKQEKVKWLEKHLPSVSWDEIVIANYGSPKSKLVKYLNGILFDDEENNRIEWGEKAYSETEIVKVLKELVNC